jgi:predicted small lipoprotein YifL
MTPRAFCIALLVALAVPACGLKGPLYLPDQKPPPAAGDKASAIQKK